MVLQSHLAICAGCGLTDASFFWSLAEDAASSFSQSSSKILWSSFLSWRDLLLMYVARGRLWRSWQIGHEAFGSLQKSRAVILVLLWPVRAVLPVKNCHSQWLPPGTFQRILECSAENYNPLDYIGLKLVQKNKIYNPVTCNSYAMDEYKLRDWNFSGWLDWLAQPNLKHHLDIFPQGLRVTENI